MFYLKLSVGVYLTVVVHVISANAILFKERRCTKTSRICLKVYCKHPKDSSHMSSSPNTYNQAEGMPLTRASWLITNRIALCIKLPENMFGTNMFCFVYHFLCSSSHISNTFYCFLLPYICVSTSVWIFINTIFSCELAFLRFVFLCFFYSFFILAASKLT